MGFPSDAIAIAVNPRSQSATVRSETRGFSSYFLRKIPCALRLGAHNKR